MKHIYYCIYYCVPMFFLYQPTWGCSCWGLVAQLIRLDGELSSFKSLDWLIHITVYKIGLCDHQMGYLAINNGDIPGSGWLLTYPLYLYFQDCHNSPRNPTNQPHTFLELSTPQLAPQRRSLKLELRICSASWMCSGNVATAAMFNQLQLIFLKFSHVDLREISQNTCT